jgi:hypothetical protein
MNDETFFSNIDLREWSGWSAHFVVYLIYMFTQVTLFDSVSGVVSSVSRLVGLLWVVTILLHAAIVTAYTARFQNRKNDWGDKPKRTRLELDMDGELIEVSDDSWYEEKPKRLTTEDLVDES